MKIRLLSSAFNDLARGWDFYEQQGAGVGGYFLDSLFSDIDSLMLYAGIHRKVFGFHRMKLRLSRELRNHCKCGDADFDAFPLIQATFSSLAIPQQC